MGKLFALKSVFLRSSSLRLSSFPVFFIIFALLFPYFLFLFQAFSWSIDFDFIAVVGMSFFQAGLSALLSVSLALLGSLGLLAFAYKKYYFVLEALLLIPAFMPALILALSLVALFEQVGLFPFGLAQLIFAQVLTWTGIISVALTRSLLHQAPLLSEWAYLHQLKASVFFKVLIRTVLKKDIQTLFVLVFVSLFTGLSLPLLLGGSSFYSLEFFIYEKLKEPHLWSQALPLILLQGFFQTLFFWT